MNLKKLMLNNFIPVPKSLIKKIGNVEAMVLSELICKREYYFINNQLNADGSFYCTIEALENDLCISRFNQLNALKKLQELGLLTFFKKGMPAKRYILLHVQNIEVYLLDSSRLISEQQDVQLLDDNSLNIRRHDVGLLDVNNSKVIISELIKEKEEESGEILQISPTPTQEKIEVEKIEKPKPKRKKMETTNEPKDYTEVLKNATQAFLDLDDELIELWNILNNDKNWKGKSDHGRHLQAVSLVDFTPEFIKHRLKIVISGGKDGAYASIVYKNTHQDFEDFLKNPKKQIQTRREGLNREIWDNLTAMPMYDTNTDYEKALKYYEAVKNNLPKTVKLQMFDEKELCTLFAAMTEEVKAKKIKEAYHTIIANPEKYNHHGLLFEAIKEIIFK